MGGFTSGWYRDGRATTNDVRSVDVRRWHRDRLLDGAQEFKWSWCQGGETTAEIRVRVETDLLWFSYQHRTHEDNDWCRVNADVSIRHTAMHFGGTRPWFECPLCAQRCAILYIRDWPCCRKCADLIYRSQRESDYDRAFTQRSKIGNRIVALGGRCLNGQVVRKPPGMHQRTFNRLLKLHVDYERAAFEAAGYG